jgi:O-succinylbenzoic acid--CoA ligase
MESPVFDVNFREEFKIITHPDLASQRERLRNELSGQNFNSHFAIFSSGTSSKELKGYILSEQAMNANAKAVNQWFDLSSEDVWGLSLPVYHVGGLSVLVRARLLGNKVIDLRKWEPTRWYRTLSEKKITITTIVPTQLYDLVKENLKAPSALRYLIVGGDFLPSELETRARNLGWPVIRTYGMTEVCSQMASGKNPGDPLSVLPIHEVRTNSEGILQVKSPALFSAVFTLGEKFSIKFSDDVLDSEGFYTTQDRVSLSDRMLVPQGRMNQEIKVAGHLTSVLTLKDTLATVLLSDGQFGKAEIVVETDERKGNRLVLMHMSLGKEMLLKITEALRPAVIDEMREISAFEKTALGKVKFK